MYMHCVCFVMCNNCEPVINKSCELRCAAQAAVQAAEQHCFQLANVARVCLTGGGGCDGIPG